MSDDQRGSWWTTAPGLVTAIAGLITALTGMLLGLTQVGILDFSSNSESTQVTTTGREGPSGNASDPDGGTQNARSEAGYEVSVPLNEEFRVDAISYEILSATASPDADGELALVMSLRGRSYRDYDENFWDASFDLTVGEDIYPASGGLNETLPANATQKGDVLFVIPDTTRKGTLTMRFNGNKKRTIPFQLEPTSG